DEVIELFIELEANDDEWEFPVIFASGMNGTASLSSDPADQEENMQVVYDAILEYVAAPIDNRDEPLQFHVDLLDYSDYVGRIGIGRVFRGTIEVGQSV